jgi:hypothetical protein
VLLILEEKWIEGKEKEAEEPSCEENKGTVLPTLFPTCFGGSKDFSNNHKHKFCWAPSY